MNAGSISPQIEANLMGTESAGHSLRIWASRILTALSVLFLLMDGGMKLFKPPFVVEATTGRRRADSGRGPCLDGINSFRY